jgi:hypothetical protein
MMPSTGQPPPPQTWTCRLFQILHNDCSCRSAHTLRASSRCPLRVSSYWSDLAKPSRMLEPPFFILFPDLDSPVFPLAAHLLAPGNDERPNFPGSPLGTSNALSRAPSGPCAADGHDLRSLSGGARFCHDGHCTHVPSSGSSDLPDRTRIPVLRRWLCVFCRLYWCTVVSMFPFPFLGSSVGIAIGYVGCDLEWLFSWLVFLAS